MQILENGKPLDFKVTLPISLTALVQQISKQINAEGRVLTSLSLNDVLYRLDALDPNKKVQDGDKLVFSSESPFAIARRSLEDALGQLDSFASEVDHVVSDLIRGNKDLAFSRFSKFLGEFRGLVLLLQTLESTFHWDYASISLSSGENKTVHDFIEHLISLLSQTKSAMETGDMVTLADLLDYEIRILFTGDLKKTLESLLPLLPHE